MSTHSRAYGGDTPRTDARARINAPRTVTANSANAIGRPGIDQSSRMVATVKNGTRVILRGVRIKGGQQAVDVNGYVSNVTRGIAKVETWGALKKPVFLPVTALSFSRMAAR